MHSLLKPTLGIAFVFGIIFLATSSAFAYGGYGKGIKNNATTMSTTRYAGTDTTSPTFVDANGDGVCDNYTTRPQDGSGRGRNR